MEREFVSYLPLNTSVAVWAVGGLRVVLAGFFIFMAIKSFSGDQKMIEDFTRWGYSEWFRMLTAGLQLVGGTLLLIPQTTFYGAGVLSCILIGALYTHIRHDPLLMSLSPTVFMLLTLPLCYFSRPDVLR